MRGWEDAEEKQDEGKGEGMWREHENRASAPPIL